MRRAFRLRHISTAQLHHRRQQRGYMMITLMLALALLSITLLAVLPEIGQQIRRDREEELRHRGTAYMVAIRRFYKRFGRYPTRVEDLENTGNVRFLRKRYKDPMNRDPKTGKERDFKFLHQQDIILNNMPALPGQVKLSELDHAISQRQQQDALANSAAQTSGSDPQPTGATSSDNPSSGDSSSGDSADSGSSSSSSNDDSGSSAAETTFGGGALLGVVSMSKQKSVRMYDQKDHYNDWLFIYLPQGDIGGPLHGPVNYGMQTPGVGGLTPGQMNGATGKTSPHQ